MRELERKVVQLESMCAAAEETPRQVYIMPKMEKLTLEQWKDLIDHPDEWIAVTFVKDGIPWYKFIKHTELPLYEGLPCFHIEIDDLKAALR